MNNNNKRAVFSVINGGKSTNVRSDFLHPSQQSNTDKIPAYAHSDRKIGAGDLIVEYSVPSECINAILDLKLKPMEKRTENDYKRLKSDRDKFETMGENELIKLLDPAAVRYISNNTKAGKRRSDAFRWAARGLNADDALRKALLM